MNELIEKLIALIDERLKEKEPAVYEIDMTKKYIIALDQPLSANEFDHIRDVFTRWAKSDEPFLIIPGVKLRLIKVEALDE